MSQQHTPWWHGPRGEWYVVVQFLLFGVIFFAPKEAPGLPQWPAPWSTVGVGLGLLLGAVGGLLIAAGLLFLGRNLTAVPHPKEDAQFVDRGAYALVRHPIYSGIIFGALGYGLLWASTLGLFYAFILLVFFDIKTRREEKFLRRKFGSYEAYATRVRKLIPFLY